MQEKYTETNKRNRIIRLLYDLPPNVISAFRYDDTAVISITHLAISRDICERINVIWHRMGNVRKPRILDAFACVGGNTIAFLEYYNDITAIELDCDRFKMLVYNMNLIYDFAPVPNRLSEFYINSSSSDRMDEYVDSSAISRDVSFKKVRFLCQDSTQHNEKYDVIFADPPWNGNEKDNTITIGELTLLEYIRDKSAELYVVKVPFNYISDFEKLEDEFAVFSETYDHPNRMKIIYIKKKYDIDCY